MSEQTGVILDHAPTDWQIVPIDDDGFATIRLSGRWVHRNRGIVEVRLLHQDSNASVSRELDWRPAETTPDGRWSLDLRRVPAGGLYRLETRYNHEGNLEPEWSARGDMRHCIGAGDLWVIAGQSNSSGYGRGPIHDPPELSVHLFRNSERWMLATHPLNDSTETRHTINRETANPGHSPHLHVGRILKQRLNRPIGLIQTALGGSALSAWNPTENPDAPLFKNMLDSIEKAGGRVRGILWYQGETDAKGQEARTYAERFVRAAGAWREALKAPDLPIVTCQINRLHRRAGEETQICWSLIREAQRQAARRLKNVAILPTLDLPFSDFTHTSPAGNMMLAERIAAAALGLAYGRPYDPAPEIRSATLTSEDRVELAFESVTTRLGTLNPTEKGFIVRDVDGDVPIERVVFPEREKIHLYLGRTVNGPAVVHGGYGVDPETLPCDVERLLPILAFHGFPIT